MSDPIDIKALDEYLKGGSDISRRYRELGSEDVPPELDRRVLNEARAAVASGGGGRARSWLRWSAPLAVAASVVLVVTVVIEMGPQNDTSYLTQPVAADKAAVKQRQLEESKLQEQVAAEQLRERQQQFSAEPPAALAPQAPAAPPPAAAAPAALAKSEPARLNTLAPPEEVRVDDKALRDQSVAAEQPAPSLAGSVSARKEAEPATAEADSSDDDLSSVSVSGTRTHRAVTGRSTGSRGASSGSALSSATRPAADEDAERADLHSDPQKWLGEIRELRRTGKVEEADRAWEQFHKAFPNFPVPADDLARKQH